MKKFNKFMTVFMLITVAFAFVSPVFGISTNFPSANGNINTVNTAASKVWGTVTTIAQILAFAAIVFAGVRYMFASADQKADIKKQLVVLVLGAVLVFGAATVVKIISGAVGDLD